ncbi:hypothetical protein OTU49_017399 [Cherax quadricarinatus]|uniref:Atos-like conserved domain-containing protein n=1 Tax=Cherax quadricarinatus TaxID=27406 RepID=A0AAW0XU52_CHEQU
MRSSNVEEVGGHVPGDPWEVFTALAILVVEGRTPGGERGYHAGPHCPLPHQLQHKHSCDQNDHVCVQAGALMRQLRVMWGVGVGVSLEVLVAPECPHGTALATTLDTTTAPSQNLRLIEQWNFTIYDRRLPEATATGWSLMAAVRSFLHFSQLSAWLSVSRGRRPPNVLYRLTVTSPVFCSKFTEEAEEHVFPLAYMGQDTSIKVAVRSLPRSDNVPVVVCHELHEEEEEVDALLSQGFAPGSSQNKKTELGKCDDDLRRSMMKAKLAENSRISRSESPDTQLGESLLDPPNSLTRFPRRYQSPSRSGSPSLETPEHLICRPRPPAPQINKPPDVSMVLGPTTPSHPFSWTQARFPITPITHHSSVDSLCSPNAEVLNLHQHRHQLQQNTYRFEFSGPYQQYRRPQYIYSRPQMCWPHVQRVQQQKPQQITPHPQRTHLSVNPCSYDQHPKSLGQLSPRGGKYQHYPEYQMQEQHEYHRPTGECPEYHRPTGEYPEYQRPTGECPEYQRSAGECPEYQRPTGEYPEYQRPTGEYPEYQRPTGEHPEYQRPTGEYPEYQRPTREYPEYQRPTGEYPEYQRPTGEYPEYQRPTGEYPELSTSYKDGRPVREYQECNPYSRLRTRGEYPEIGASGQDFNSGRDQGLKRRGEYPSEWECQTDHQHSKREYFQQFPSDNEASTSNSKMGISVCSTRVKQSHLKLGKQTQETLGLPKVIDDQLRLSCLYTGKHLCSSLEDLSEIGKKGETKSSHLHSKALKQEMKKRGDVSPSHLFHSKFNFELTPKETMEILSVLRQPTPVPPLRIDRHRNKSQTESPRSACESSYFSNYQGHVSSKSWEEKEIDVKCANCTEKKIDGRYWKEGKLESLHLKEQDGKTDCKFEKDERKTGDVFWNKCKKNVGPKDPSLGFHGHSEKCHKENWDKDVQELTSSPENLFLEAIARSGEKHCDISSCKTLVDSSESYRTRVCSDISKESCDKRSAGEYNEQVNYDSKNVCGQSVQSFLSSSQSRCIEAKKITQKTSFFTATSEPTLPVTSQPQKQTSQNLVKSPFSAVLSSFQKEYNHVFEEEQDHSQDSVQLKSLKEKETVKRALKFEDGRAIHSVVVNKTEKNISNGNYLNEKFPSEVAGQTILKIKSQDTGKIVRDTHEGFLKSTSLLKHLMTKNHQPAQDNTQDNKSPNYENNDMEWSEVVGQGTHDKSEAQEMVVQEEEDFGVQLRDLNHVDDEVEKICNGKGVPIPSASEKAQFRRSLDSATNMVFHSKTGLPLTSSPAPLRKGKRFDYDSSLNSVAAIKSALYTCDNDEEEVYTVETNAAHINTTKSTQLSISAPATVTCSNLLGSFEECVLNGRLEPVSTVQGFTAEIAASGSFCPKRITKPVTVFFYTLCDNDQISSPYMGHINLGKKGYHVPNKGTVQVTLFNPHGTVVKMFVVMYDLSDMPANSRTFVRQRTLNMPVGASDSDPNAHQWLRYLIHLRFVSSKSGKIYLHTDIRMLIFRKSDADAATLHKTSVPYELRSFTHGPTNPKFSPRK